MDRTYIRKYPRVGVSFPVEYTVGGQTYRGRAVSLGGGGLFLAVQGPLVPGTQISLRFRPAKHLPFIAAKAKVCYQVPGRGVGVEFTEISPENRRTFLRLILRRQGDKRKYPRAPLAAQIESQGSVSLALSRNVSPGGMFIETTQPLSVGSRINLRFNLDDGGPIVVARAEVTYLVANLGMGVQFINLPPTALKRIETHVSKSIASVDQASAAEPPQ